VTTLGPTPAREIPQTTNSVLADPFWEGCQRGELLFQRCSNCAAAVFEPAAVCGSCGARELQWERSRGQGSLYSWSVVHRPQTADFIAPYAVIIVDLDEGYSMLSNMIDCDTGDLRIGLRLEVVFVDVAGRCMPYFRPIKQAASNQESDTGGNDV
jgi:hypothetical protein